MERINKMIKGTILEIVIVISLVLISIPIWNSFSLEEYESVAMYYENIKNISLEVDNLEDYTLYQAYDDYAIKNIKPITLELVNNSTNEEEYNINLIVSKNSTLNYENIKIYYNNSVKYLKEYDMTEDEAYYYFEMDKGNIIKNNIQQELIMWIDANTKENISNKYLSFEITNITGQFL